MAAGAAPQDWSQTGREFQLRVENCRRCLVEGLPNVAWCSCAISLISDLGHQVSEVRHGQVNDRAAVREHSEQLRRELSHLQFRMIGFDDPVGHPEEVGVVGDIRNQVLNVRAWIKAGAIAFIGLCATLTGFLLEQALAAAFHWTVVI